MIGAHGRRAGAVAALALVALVGCKRRADAGALEDAATTAPLPTPAPPTQPESIAFDMLEASPRCRIFLTK